MRRTRFMTLMFLGLSMAFFGVQEFRWAWAPVLTILGGENFFRFAGIAEIPPNELLAFGEAADKSGDAGALAFAALHAGGAGADVIGRRADQAVAKDPQYSWLYYHLAYRAPSDWAKPEMAPRVEKWIQALEVHDPDNAAVWLMRSEFVRARIPDWKLASGELNPDNPALQAMAERTEWRAAMERAYRSPRYSTYIQPRFELERTVMREQGWAKPLTMLFYVASYPIPNLLNVREYANFEVHYLGAQAERARRLDVAIGHYRTAATFGRRMRVNSVSLIEELIGMAVQKIGNEPLLTALKKANRNDEAAQVELETREWQRTYARVRGDDPIAVSSAYYWSALLVNLSALLVVIFGALTLVCLLYVNAKRWIRREKRGRIYQLMTIAENYLPVLLFASCLALYLTYKPYATNFNHYLTASGEITSLEPFFFNTLPNPIVLPRGYYLPVERPFGDYAWWALGAVLVAAILAGFQELRLRRQQA